jgi:hypothetical protein
MDTILSIKNCVSRLACQNCTQGKRGKKTIFCLQELYIIIEVNLCGYHLIHLIIGIRFREEERKTRKGNITTM